MTESASKRLSLDAAIGHQIRSSARIQATSAYIHRYPGRGVARLSHADFAC